jgi:hypothetical protein
VFWDFPAIFEDFKQQNFTLLWRGSRDGFGARDFHIRCDGHPNTLTVIFDTDGNIFGGFTPVEWESRKWNGQHGKEDGRLKADRSRKSFLFTVKNPHNVPARRFGLTGEEKDRAIARCSDRSPHFCDIGIRENCNAHTCSFCSKCGNCYTNDTERDGHNFFTKSGRFQGKEIEVFEITE